MRMQVQGHPSILALSSRSWLDYTYQGLLHFSPLISEPWNHACGLAAEQCPEDLIGITGNLLKCVNQCLLTIRLQVKLFYLRIFEVPRLGPKLMQTSMPLTYTPRKFVTHPFNQYFYMIEADHRVMGEDAAKSKRIGKCYRKVMDYSK